MTHYFKGKTFIVTGASSGIGRSLAIRLAEEGANLTVMARTESALEQLVQEGQTSPLIFPGDVTDQKACKNLVRTTVDVFGRLDGLIHNAGVSMRAHAFETRVQTYRTLMEVNFFSMVFLFQHVLPHIEKTKGHIAAVSSMMGQYSTQERSGYNASKHALQGFMNSVRLEVMDKGVHVMVASPGFVKTRGSLNALTADGSPYGKMDNALAGGLSPDKAARIILAGMARRKRDVFPAGPREKLGLFLSKWAPAMLDKALVKSTIK